MLQHYNKFGTSTSNQNPILLQNEEPSEIADYSITDEQIDQRRPSLYQTETEIEQRKRNEAMGESRGLQLSILDNINTLRKGKK